MTAKITLTYGDAELVVTGTYHPYTTWRRHEASDFIIDRIEQAGADVTERYRRMRLIPLLEDMAREVVESN